MEDRKVIILLSTYNGEKYLEEQLDSILQQDVDNIEILIRDDGSKDNTLNILEKYRKNYPQKIKGIIKGENIGVIKSFFYLIEYVTLDYDCYMFCDQDDYWCNGKIKRVLEIFDEYKEEKKGYFSNLFLVNEHLKIIKKRYDKKLLPSLRNCFFENIVTGCTYAANREMFKEIQQDYLKIKNELNFLPMHDRHFYFLTCLKGRLIYDIDSFIYYRQHGNNVIGMEKSTLKAFKKRILDILKRKKEDKRITYLKFIEKHYKDELPNIERIFLEEFLGNYNCFLKKLIFIIFNKFTRQNKYDEYFSKITYLMGKF